MKARKIIYGLVGILVGILVYITYLTSIPQVPQIKPESTNLNINEVDKNIDATDKKRETPLAQFCSYHIGIEDMNRFKNSKLVSYGRENPMFYWVYTPVQEQKKEDEEEEKEKPQSNENFLQNKIIEYPNENKAIKLLPKEVLGFDIESGELTPLDVENIAKLVYAGGVLPVKKEFYQISSKFGPRLDPIEKINTFHVGLDIASKDISGKEVMSMLPGVVSEKSNHENGYGNFITVNHGEFSTIYAHLNKFAPNLNVGDNVLAGSIVGYVGETGRSTGPHLHLEFKVGSIKLDPEIFIDLILKRENI